MVTNDRLIEIMAELLAEARDSKIVNLRMAEEIGRMAEDTSELKSQMAKNNAAVGELRLSVMRLADRIDETYHLDQWVRLLESIVLPQPPLQAA